MENASQNHTPSKPIAKPKLDYVANLKSSLTALVILHHAATSYGGDGRNVYQSTTHPPGSCAALIGFNAINQSFFMGTFMFLGGHFSRKALQRKSCSQFVKDRLYRLGLPTVAYTALGAPAAFAVLRIWKGEEVNMRFLLDYWKDMRGARGPLWFTATLLTLDVFQAGLTLLPRSDTQVNGNVSKPTMEHIRCLPLLTCLSLTTLADFLVRLRYPIGTIFTPLKLNVGYAPQYLAAYIFGASVSDVDYAIPSSGTLLGLTVLASVSSRFLARSFFGNTSGLDLAKGGYNELAFQYAIWNNFTGYCLGSAVLCGFEKYAQASWGSINDIAFPAFIVHIPVLTIIGCATDRWSAGPITKTAIIGTATVTTSWCVGWIGQSIWNRLVGPRTRKSKSS